MRKECFLELWLCGILGEGVQRRVVMYTEGLWLCCWVYEYQYQFVMVLTTSQKNQLNKDILEYLVNNQYAHSAECLAEEIGANLADVDPEGNKLQVKWKSILSLQKKINNLEEQVKNLQDDLAKGPQPKAKEANLEELYLPKTPAKLELKGHKASITCLAFHPLYTQVATSSEDGTIKIWEFETGDYERTLKGHTNPVNHVVYHPQGHLLASCSSDLTIKLWDLNNDYVCSKTLFGHNHNISCLAFLAEGDQLVSCSRDKMIKLWDTQTGYCKRTWSGHQGWVRRIAVSNDGQTIVSGSDDQSIIIWNIQKEAPILRFFAHDNVIEAVAIVQGEQSAKLMNADFLKHKFTGEARLQALKQLNQEGKEGMGQYYQWFILTGSRDKLIKLFLGQTGEHLHSFIGHDNWVRSLSLHPNGKYLYSASDDKTLRIWDLQYGKEKKKIQAHEHFVSTVKFNPKYGVLGSAGNDMVLKIWHLK